MAGAGLRGCYVTRVTVNIPNYAMNIVFLFCGCETLSCLARLNAEINAGTVMLAVK